MSKTKHRAKRHKAANRVVAEATAASNALKLELIALTDGAIALTPEEITNLLRHRAPEDDTDELDQLKIQCLIVADYIKNIYPSLSRQQLADIIEGIHLEFGEQADWINVANHAANIKQSGNAAADINHLLDALKYCFSTKTKSFELNKAQEFLTSMKRTEPRNSYDVATNRGIRKKFESNELTSHLLLLDSDMEQMLDIFGIKKQVSVIELTEENVGSTLRLRLRDSKGKAFTAPLLLRINGNHWVRALVIVEAKPASGKRNVRVRYKDSFSSRRQGNGTLTAGIKATIGDCDVSYDHIREPNKQNDGWSCGYRALKSLLDDSEFPDSPGNKANFPLRAFRAIKASASSRLYSQQLESFVYRYLLAEPQDLDMSERELNLKLRKIQKAGIDTCPNQYELLNESSSKLADVDTELAYFSAKSHRNDHNGRMGGTQRIELAEAISQARAAITITDNQDNFIISKLDADYLYSVIKLMDLAALAMDAEAIDKLAPTIRDTITLINVLKNDEKPTAEKLEQINQYEKSAASRPLSKSVWQAVKGIIFAAIGMVTGIFVCGLIGAGLGAFTGPGAAFTAAMGIVAGAVKGATIGWSLGSAASGAAGALATTGLFAYRYRKTDVEKQAAEIATTARRMVIATAS